MPRLMMTTKFTVEQNNARVKLWRLLSKLDIQSAKKYDDVILFVPFEEPTFEIKNIRHWAKITNVGVS